MTIRVVIGEYCKVEILVSAIQQNVLHPIPQKWNLLLFYSLILTTYSLFKIPLSISNYFML